ncbi:MAG TPA: hypothetical protein VEH56_02805 [Candidatus Saccharimonadales bacterium]|nr:hypothetical protein [Candidatus Saccharimonadales bacterium]
MNNSQRIIVCLVLALVLIAPILDASALPPLGAGTFPTGTFVVPMDGKQADRVHVYGFIHEFLRNTPNGEIARVIETPDVTMQTGLTPSGALYQGGPFLITQGFSASVNALLANATFSKVTVTQLSVPFTSNQIFFVRQATKILVVFGVFGRTDLTLSRMGISYTLVQPDQLLDNPSMINSYTLIVIDCPGWYGNPGGYTATRRSRIQAVYNTLQSRVQAGNEVIYTDIALLDLNSTFPGYVNIGPGGAGSWAATVYNPPKSEAGGSFPSEFPSQYYNPGVNPNSIKLFTEGGGRVVSSIQPAHQSDVRVLIDTTQFGIPHRSAILGFYFQYGNGIVEGLAFHPYEQLYPTYADMNGYYATYEIYGNKFVHGPQSDFFVSATPPVVTVQQGQTASYTVGVTSVGSFSAPVFLQVSGAPSNSVAGLSPGTVTPPSGGTGTSVLTVATSTNTPLGSYNLTITGSSTLPAITRTTSVTLIVRAGVPDFSINVSPNILVLQPSSCGNVSVSVQSFGNFSAPVNLTLSPIPQHVTHVRFIPDPIRPAPGGSVGSVLGMCADSSAMNATYPLTVTGSAPTSPPGPHTATLTLQIIVPASPPSGPLNWWLILLLLGMLFLALAIAFLAVIKSRRGALVVGRRRPRLVQVLPVPLVRCRFCSRVMPIYSVYCPYCGRAPVVVAPPPPRPRPRAPVVRGSILAFILALVSGILILVNSAALLMPGFYALWSPLFFWLPVIGPTYAFALGALIGLTIILASIIMILSSGALADVLIFPFAVFSLIIGGGFIAGMIIGIIAGILAVLKRR